MIRQLTNDVRVKITRVRKTDLELEFQVLKKVWILWVWKTMRDRKYLITIKDFWDPFRLYGKGGAFKGVPMRFSGSSFVNYEIWKPDDWDLEQRIADELKEINKEMELDEKINSILNENSSSF